MLLRNLIKDISYKVLTGTDDIEVNCIQYDSRKVKKGDVFVCIQGYKVDGHTFIDNALKRGAAAIIVEKDVQISSDDIAAIKTVNTRKALASMASIFYDNPSQKFSLIGVTGTNGKTSTTYMLKSIFSQLGDKVGIIGTIANMIGDKTIHTERTTPESLELQQLLSQMADEKVDKAAMEVSSHALALDRVYGCNFKVGIFTNLTRDHLDFHKTFEDYAKAKAKLFQIAEKAVINIDDEYSKYMLEAAKGEVMTYGINNNSDIHASNIEISARGVKYHLKTPIGETDIFVKIPGIFTVYNSLGCIGAAIALGIPLEKIKKGIEEIKGVPGRFELVETDTDYSVIVDYAHTPDGLENILNTAKEFAKGNIITVFGCGGDRDRTKRPIMGEIAARLSDICIATSDNPRTEVPTSIIKEIIPGIEKVGTKYEAIVDRRSGIKKALELAKKDDIVIVAGKGHEDYQILKDKTIHFDDKEVIKELVNEISQGGKL